MLLISKKNARPVYAVLHFLYFSTYALMFAYASAYLQGSGFTNAQIGLVIGCSFLLASVLQPAFVKLFGRSRYPTEKCMSFVYGAIALLSLLLFLVKNRLAAGICAVCVMGSHAALQPCLNSCVQSWNRSGCTVHYGSARSLGSLAYAVTSFSFGLLLKTMASGVLPLFYGSTSLVFSLLLFCIRLPEAAAEKPEEVPAGDTDTAAGRDRRFWIVIIGICFLIFGHTIIDNYILQILQHVGGNSSQVGLVGGIGAAAEILAMLCFDRFSKRFGDNRLLLLASAVWVVKHFLTFLAESTAAVCCIELLQFFGYAIYTPAIVSYVNSRYSGKENMKWLAYTGSAYTVGAVLASFCGGFILDAAGAGAMLLTATGASLVGTGIFLLYFGKKHR